MRRTPVDIDFEYASGDSMFLQLSGSGREERPQRQRQLTDRLLFMVNPDAGSASSATQRRQELRAKHRSRGKAMATERLHVTLHHVGDFAGLPAGIVAKTCAVASAVPMWPFTVEFNGALTKLPWQAGQIALGAAGR